MQRRQRRLAAVASAAVAAFGLLAAHAHAQYGGACCLPDKTCILVDSPWECGRENGIFLGVETTCTSHPCADHYVPGVGMSQTAARRLTRQGVVHTLWHAGDPAAVYAADHLMWYMHEAYGQIIAPHISIDLEKYWRTTPQESAEAAAARVIELVGLAKTAWDGREDDPPKNFYWALRIDRYGQGFDWSPQTYDGENFMQGSIPLFSNHPGDVIEGKLDARRYIPSHNGTVGDVTGTYSFKVKCDTGSWIDWCAFFSQFSEEYYLEDSNMNAWPAKIKIDGYDPVDIVGYNQTTQEFALHSSFTGTLTEDVSTFQIWRHDAYGNPNLWPCYFFKNGAAELSTWTEYFCAYLGDAENWPDDTIIEPVAVIIPTEDIGAVTVDYDNYLAYVNHPKADAEHLNYEGDTVDGTLSLKEWHALYAKDRNEDPLSTGDPLVFSPGVVGPHYAPYNEDLHSYLASTFITAYNHHREEATWTHFRAIWPRAILTQYLIGKGYGVTYDPEEDVREVPGGPGESGYHGVPGQWKESVNWDAYGCIPGSRIPWEPLGDGRVVPLWQHSGVSTTGEAGSGATLNALNKVPVQSFSLPQGETSGPPFDPTGFLVEGYEVFIEFVDGPNAGVYRKVIDYDDDILTLATPDSLVELTNASDPFIIYYPATPQYTEYFTSSGVVKWPLIETFCERYGEPVTAAGFAATGKKWAAEQARAQTYALPENPYTLTLGPDFKDGNDELVSMWATYPNLPFTSQDGWLSDFEWGDVASQARDYGVNHFDWFVPGLIVNTGTPEFPVWETTAAMDTVFYALYTLSGSGSSFTYHNIACIADWDGNGVVEAEDAVAFGNALVGEDPTTDLNNDGFYTSADLAIYEAAFCVGDCAPIDDPGCTGSGNCADADWCGDTNVGIDDIFCFLSDWFAMDYDARNYGGTEGVAAIFAFLGNWFAWGIGPCSP